MNILWSQADWLF